MALYNTANRWGALAQLLHWGIFLLIVSAWWVVEAAGELPKGDAARGELMLLHKSMGFTVFLLVWLRLAWRLANPTPRSLIVSPWQDRAARLTHWALYGLMIAMPLSAMLAAQLGGRPLPWFGLFEIAPFLAENKDLAKALMGLHKDVFWPLLSGLVLLHAAAALWHQLIIKDGLLRRMLPGARD